MSKLKVIYTLKVLCLYVISYYLVLIPWPFVGYIPWPLDFYVASFIFFIALKIAKCAPEKISFDWKLTRGMLFSLVMIVLSSTICLGVYFYYNQEVAKQFPDLNVPAWSLPFIILAAALINGFREELYYRFILQNTLSRIISFRGAIIISSVLFGLIHYKASFPQGCIGVLLTTLFGLLIGLQYFFYKSVLLTALTHALTDAIMFSIILLSK